MNFDIPNINGNVTASVDKNTITQLGIMLGGVILFYFVARSIIK